MPAPALLEASVLLLADLSSGCMGHQHLRVNAFPILSAVSVHMYWGWCCVGWNRFCTYHSLLLAIATPCYVGIGMSLMISPGPFFLLCLFRNAPCFFVRPPYRITPWVVEVNSASQLSVRLVLTHATHRFFWRRSGVLRTTRVWFLRS